MSKSDEDDPIVEPTYWDGVLHGMAKEQAIWRQRLEQLTEYKVFLQQLASARATLPSPSMVVLKALAIMNGQDSQENQAQRL